MKALVLVTLLALSTSTACRPPPRTTASAPSVAPSVADTASRAGTLRMDRSADPDVVDLPMQMALDELRDMGYTIETVSFDDKSLAVAALDQGQLDIAMMNCQTAWAAIAKGVPMFTIMDKSANVNLLLTTRSLGTCGELNGRPLAVAGVTAISAVIVDAYVASECPGTVYEKVIISGGGNRLAALLTGTVDGATLDIDALLEVEQERPGEFHALVYFAQEFPGIQLDTCVVRRTFADENPQAVKDVIQAVMRARRGLRDRATLEAAMVRYLDYDAERAREASEAYTSREIWDMQGGYDLLKVQATLDFLKANAGLPQDLEAGDVADLSLYREAVLELGTP